MGKKKSQEQKRYEAAQEATLNQQRENMAFGKSQAEYFFPRAKDTLGITETFFKGLLNNDPASTAMAKKALSPYVTQINSSYDQAQQVNSQLGARRGGFSPTTSFAKQRDINQLYQDLIPTAITGLGALGQTYGQIGAGSLNSSISAGDSAQSGFGQMIAQENARRAQTKGFIGNVLNAGATVASGGLLAASKSSKSGG